MSSMLEDDMDSAQDAWVYDGINGYNKWKKPREDELFFSVPFDMVPCEIPLVCDGMLSDAMTGDFPHHDEWPPPDRDSQYKGEGDFLKLTNHPNPRRCRLLIQAIHYAFSELMTFFRNLESPEFTRQLQEDLNVYYRKLFARWMESGKTGSFTSEMFLFELNRFTYYYKKYARYHFWLNQSGQAVNYSDFQKRWDAVYKAREKERFHRAHPEYKIPKRPHPLADYAWMCVALMLHKAQGMTHIRPDSYVICTGHIQKQLNQACCDYEAKFTSFQQYKKDISDIFRNAGAWAISIDIVAEFEKFVRLQLKKAFIKTNRCFASHLDVVDPTKSYCVYKAKPYMNQQTRVVVGQKFQCQLKDDPRIDPTVTELEQVDLPEIFW